MTSRGGDLPFSIFETTPLEFQPAELRIPPWRKCYGHRLHQTSLRDAPVWQKGGKLSGSNIIGLERRDSESWRILEFMLIHTKLPPGHLYPQLTQFPTKYPDFLAAFRGGQTVDNNTHLTTGNAVQTHLYKAAIASGHLTTKGNPIQGEFLVDIFLTDEGGQHILTPQDKQYCKMAVELARKSIAENDGEPHPYVGAVVIKNGKVLATGYRGETGEGRHAEFCALKKINDDVDNVDLSGCTVYTTLEPCSIRKPSKIPCTNRLINGKVARVVYGLADKDETVYGHSSLSEAGIEIGLFPKDLIEELLVLNKKWSDTRRNPEVMPPSNDDTVPLAYASYHKSGRPMTDNVQLFVRPPKEVGGFFTVEDAAKKVMAYGRTIEEISVEWRRIDTQKVIVEKLVRQGHGGSSQLLHLI
jgi:pyrimidine deaminase RibD-like protein